MEFSRPEYWSSGSCSHLHGIFPTQGSNPGLPHCRQILYQLSQPGKPNTGEGGLSLLQESSWPRNQTRVSYNAGRFFTSWATRKAHWVLAAAKSLQSCPTLCDPIDGSLRGSSVPGILQARTLECTAISFSNSSKCKVEVKLLSPVRLFATP